MKPMAVILAGGRARRMGGGDKCLLPLGNKRLLDHVLARLEGQTAGLVLNANGDPARFEGYGVRVVPDSVAEYPGPLAGILAGMDAAAEARSDWLVSVACDTPFYPTDLIARLQAARGDAPIVLAATSDPTDARARGFSRHPTFGLWSVALRHDLRAALDAGTRKVIAWTDQLGAVSAIFPGGDPDPFFNINTPGDLARAEAMLP